MNRANLLRARMHSGAQSAAYLSVLSSLLMLSGYLMLGGWGVVLMLTLTLVTLIASARVPTHAVMRMRGARPLHAGEADPLQVSVTRLARAARLVSVPVLYLVPGPGLQAFAVNSGGQAAIAITPRLVRELSTDELEAVLAHEISHIASGDTRVMRAAAAMRGLTRSLASLAWLLLLLDILAPGALSVSLGPMLIFLAAPMLSYLAELGLSRAREFHADLAAAELTGRPEPLARALFKLEQHQTGLLQRLVRGGTIVPMPEGLRTHPSTSERIRRLLGLSEAPPHGGSGGCRPRSARSPRRRQTPRSASATVAGRAPVNQALSSTRWSVTMS